MTRDEVLCALQSLGIEPIDDEVLDDFTHVAELAAAAEQERLNKKIAALEADVDHFFKLSGQYLERANKAEEAIAAERERCAEVCCTLERMRLDVFRNGGRLAEISPADCAVAIRGQKNED